MGACYWHGRDRRMRPLLIISLQRLQQLQREAAAEEKVTRLVIFCLEFFLRYLCVAGVVENWCILCDLNGTSISSFPLPLLLRLMQLIQGSYRGRLYRFYILYAPRLFHFIAKPLVSSLPTTTAKKLRVFTSLDDWYQERRTQFAAHQLEKKYGGTASDITEHWYPFRFFPGPFEPECEAGCSGLKKMDVRWESEQALHAKVVHQGDATEFSKAQNSPAETSKEACSSSGLSLTNNTGGIEAVEEGQNRSKKAAGIFPYGAVPKRRSRISPPPGTVLRETSGHYVQQLEAGMTETMSAMLKLHFIRLDAAAA
ncbi:hypothetical protein, conserved [Eimeria brunetti]|uniref:CRAL-TRIO domain-containing protein n=1 Tax=Eimeria brunetti TaxID=51314 RepID=U6LUQ8_9EIME|nr:hypothetical protein, conserved [Eimeria brunetti]